MNKSPNRSIIQGDFVRHYDSREVYKVLEVDDYQASLVDAMNNHYGSYPINELRLVDKKKVKIRQIWIMATCVALFGFLELPGAEKHPNRVA